MKIHFRIIGILLLTIFLVLGSCRQPVRTSAQVSSDVSQKPYVVILSMDGFRWDYPDKVITPNLNYMAENGVKARSLQPCFPSKTFPNHYSMATGLYPDHNGIVNNSFYDRALDAHYAIEDRDAVEDGRFYAGEPLWVTAEKQHMITASYFWVGSEASIENIRPTYWKEYDKDISFERRIDTVVYWLQLPTDKRPHLVMLYFEEPDVTGHDYGPESQHTMSKVVYMDSLVGVLITKLKTLSIYDQINLIVTSDHGMAQIFRDKTEFLGEKLDRAWFDAIEGSNPIYNLYVKDIYFDTVYSILNRIQHISTWKRGEVPPRLHYGNNPRVGDIIVVADSLWSVRWSDRGNYMYGGTHGYDNRNMDMHAIFYALGPAFKKGYVQPTFENTDIYPLVSHILGLASATTDGTLEHIAGMLKSQP
ncbi:MAG: ectonucleotide pyrophosphatase/phosphodiesterase [Bacteroidetes bacterium]|nr:ectonucleotide pyrophosphatase/phosphodiesterase [Bacteroidota bacterium]